MKIVARVINHNETIVPCVMGGYNNPLPKLFSPIKNVTFLAYNMNWKFEHVDKNKLSTRLFMKLPIIYIEQNSSKLLKLPQDLFALLVFSLSLPPLYNSSIKV